MAKARNFATWDGSKGIDGMAIQMSKIGNSNSNYSNYSMPVAIGSPIWHRESNYVEVGCEY
jgi:hypothetical protein